MTFYIYRRSKVGDILQISPDVKSKFGGCLMIVTNKTDTHVEGFVPTPKGSVLVKAKYENLAWCGVCKWYPENNLNEFNHDFNEEK